MSDSSSIERVIDKAKRRLGRKLVGDRPVEVGTEHIAAWRGQHYKLFFMVGFPRSGTNWCGAILNRHPKIHIHGEYHFEMLAKGFRDLWEHPWQVTADPTEKLVAECAMRDAIRRILVEGARRRPDAEWIGDRTPRWLDVLLPGAPHILMMRDPRDILVSFIHHDLSKGGFLLRVVGERKKLEDLRKQFREDEDLFKKDPHLLLANEKYVRGAMRQMVFWAERNLKAIKQHHAGELGAPLHMVRYEALHADPEGERAKMYEFLGLDAAAAEALDEDSLSKPGLSKEQPTGMFRKGKTGSWREHFTEDARDWFEEEIGEISRELGYPCDDWDLIGAETPVQETNQTTAG